MLLLSTHFLPYCCLPASCTTINKDASKSQKSMTVWHDYLHRHHHDHHNIIVMMMIYIYVHKVSSGEMHTYLHCTHAAEIQRYWYMYSYRKEGKKKCKYASSFCLLPIFVHACEKRWDEHVTFCERFKKKVVWWYIFRKAIIVKTHSVFS